MAVVEEPVTPDKPKYAGDIFFDAHISSAHFGKNSQWRKEITSTETITNNVTLEPFGFRISQDALYQGGEQLLSGITYFSQITTSASGKNFLLLLKDSSGKEWFLSKDGLFPWNQGNHWFLANPILNGEEILYPLWDQKVNIIANGKSIYSLAIVLGAEFHVDLFTSWNGHWLLENHGMLIQDGVILNEALGYEEMFEWRLLNEKPFYFFRKGPKVGISWDGKILPLTFDDVFYHGCCGYSGYNLRGNKYSVGFFALREGMWRYVELGFTEDK